MNDPSPATAISPLRQRLIDDMNVRRFSRETQRNYIRDVGRFATFLGRSPDTATADDGGASSQTTDALVERSSQRGVALVVANFDRSNLEPDLI